MKASAMMINLMRVKADTSGVFEPHAPCSGQSFYRRVERRVNLQYWDEVAGSQSLFLKKYAEKPPPVPSFAPARGAKGPAEERRVASSEWPVML
jgi:hypothetical protein